MREIDAKLYQRLEKLIQSLSFELVGCELQSQGRHLTFRIYIDSPTGVTIDNCSAVSHQISAMLDVENPFQGRYSLEVSSPGIDRPLFKLEQYLSFIGRKAKLKLQMPINNRRKLQGVLTRIEENNVYILLEGSNQEIEVPYDMIEKANLIGEINSSKKKAND